MLVQRSSQALIDYYTMLFPSPTSLIRQSMQKRVDMIIIKVQSITNHFLWKVNKISLVYLNYLKSSYLYFYDILWKLRQPAKFFQCLITSVPVPYKLISYLKENIKFNKHSIPYGEQQKYLKIWRAENAHYSCRIRPGYFIEVISWILHLFYNCTPLDDIF